MHVALLVGVPPHAPPQAESTYPAAGAAESVIELPCAYVELQVPGQLTPAGELTSVPLPVTVTVSVPTGAKFALTVRFESMVSVQSPVPLQSPVHPVNR